MSNKIKNLMAGGRSRLEKDKTTAPKNKTKHKRQPILKSETQSEAPRPQPEKEEISAAPEPQPKKEEISEAPIQQPKKEEISMAVPPQPTNGYPDDIRLNNLTPQMRESLRIVMKNNISPECMKAIEAMSTDNKDFMPSFIKLGPHAMAAFCNIAKDEDYVITTKIKLISLLNRISRNEIVHKIFRRVGAAIEAMRRLKDLLLIQ
ncbi:MAG: hypothetical protein HQL01_08640 [Nitrospirae bacterium]|nr:hypothetical protein [Nitrospirota bacterium]